MKHHLERAGSPLCNHGELFDAHLQGIQKNQRRVGAVICLTLVMMVAEILAGRLTGSMALEADGYHMASHAGALGISYLAYRLTRSQSIVQRMNFGTGKVLSLGGYSSAIVLALVALWMLFESVHRIFNPVKVEFDEALWVAALGLVVNLVSAWMLGWGEHGHEHHHHSHEHHHQGHEHHHQGHEHHHQGHEHHHHSHEHHHQGHEHHHHRHEHHHHDAKVDRNHQSALMHVLADALTSVLAIVALLLGRATTSAAWLDPAMGIVGAFVILRWAWNLLRQTAWELLDAHPEGVSLSALRQKIEDDGHVVHDLHLWSQGRGNFVGMLAVEPDSERSNTDFRTYFTGFERSLHLLVERLSPADKSKFG